MCASKSFEAVLGSGSGLARGGGIIGKAALAKQHEQHGNTVFKHSIHFIFYFKFSVI